MRLRTGLVEHGELDRAAAVTRSYPPTHAPPIGFPSCRYPVGRVGATQQGALAGNKTDR